MADKSSTPTSPEIQAYNTSYSVRKRCHVPTRLVFIVLMFLASVNNYGMRVNLSVALVAMVNNTDTNQHYSYCKGLQNDTHMSDTTGQFNWDIRTQGIILSSFFYGYIFTQIPGSILSKFISAKWTLGLSMLLSAVLNLLTPYAAYHGFRTLIASRICLGFVQGVFYPAYYNLMGLWIPPKERSTAFSFIAGGTCLGSTIYLVVSGVLASSNVMQGWPSVFYLSGIAGVLLCFLWFPFVYDSPSVHPWISRQEREYIMEALEWDKHAKQTTVPRFSTWISMLRSLPVWSVVICQVCSEFGFFIFLAETPSYFSNVQGFDLSQSGFLSGLPWIMQFIIGIASGILADILIRRNLFRVGTVRKGFTFTCLLLQCGLFLVTAYSGCNTVLVTVCFITAVSIGGMYIAGYGINKLDIAPNMVSFISGIINMLTTIGGMAGPLLVAFIIGETPTADDWKPVFVMISIVLAVGVIVFVIFGSGEHQSWDKELAISAPIRDCNNEIITPLLEEQEDFHHED